MKSQKILILDNIRSVFNVGSIFRTADAIGISHIYLVGTTPTPVDRFGRARLDLAKVALGAEKTIAWSYSKDIGPLINKLKKAKAQIIAVEQAPTSLDYKKIKTKNSVALILGNEVSGVNKKTLAQADIIIEIPMVGMKESLNVAVTFGIVAFRLFDR